MTRKKDGESHQVDTNVMRRTDMNGYKINNRLFNVDDGAYFDKIEFIFEQKDNDAYCSMGKIQSYIPNTSKDLEEVRDALVWANVKCWLKNKYGKDYYKEYTRTDLE